MGHLEPLVIQSVLPAESLLLVQHEKLSDQVLALLGNGLKFNVVEVIIRLFDLAENLSSVGALEWQVTADQRVEEHTERPDVGFLAVGALEHLWCHVVRSSRHRGQLAVVARGL